MKDNETATPRTIEGRLVVIGGGGSGLAAALTAAENGTEQVFVLEKRNVTGGNTSIATGLFACESPVQVRNRIVADKDALFKHAMEWCHWHQINPKIVRAFLNKSGDTVAWLEKKGLEFTIITFFPNQNPRVEHVANGRGAHVTRVLEEGCRKSGVQILTGCAATDINTSNGTDFSVTAEYQGSQIEIKTRGIIIATGGFGGNKAMLKKMCRQYYDDMPLRGLPLMGDGITLAEKAGAAIEPFVPLLKEGPRVDKNIWPLGALEREPVTVWVNKLGKRFADEATGSHPFEGANQILYQPDKMCFSLLDTRIKDLMLTKTPDLDQHLLTEIKKGRARQAATWEEIAVWIGAEPEILAATIEEYNACCDAGYDAAFAKDRRHLMALRIPPFYAIRDEVDILDTLGGITINERMEVLNTRGIAITGLFAAGVTTGGWQSESYCSDLSGSAFGYAINSGRIAGENAARYCRSKTA